MDPEAGGAEKSWLMALDYTRPLLSVANTQNNGRKETDNQSSALKYS